MNEPYLFALRSASGECPAELTEWWEKFQHASPDVREDMLKPAAIDEKRPRRRRRPRKPGGDGADDAGGTPSAAPAS